MSTVRLQNRLHLSLSRCQQSTTTLFTLFRLRFGGVADPEFIWFSIDENLVLTHILASVDLYFGNLFHLFEIASKVIYFQRSEQVGYRHSRSS